MRSAGHCHRRSTQARLHGRLHSLSRDRAAISHHYDLSNEFYRLILDPSDGLLMRAIGKSRMKNTTLEQAQSREAGPDLSASSACDERPDMWLLDVGCGWGSLSLHAAEHYDAQVVGITLSSEQKAYIDAALHSAGT